MKKFLIVGRPGAGKTTLIKKVAQILQPFHPVGFYTEEIREQGERVGFELVSLDGQRRIMSHVDIPGPFRVGKYGVDVARPLAMSLFLSSLRRRKVPCSLSPRTAPVPSDTKAGAKSGKHSLHLLFFFFLSLRLPPCIIPKANEARFNALQKPFDD